MPRCTTCHRRVSSGGSCPDHAAPDIVEDLTEDAHLEVPGYTRHHRLGAGGFALVYSASRREDGAQVALKIARLRNDWRFEREAEALRAVGAPHAPQLVDAGAGPDGRPYLAMELVAGRSLADWLGTLPAAAPARGQALNVLRGICVTVDAIHEAGFIHRDLKPENMILHAGGVTVLDFGLARRREARDVSVDELAGTIAGQRVGTPMYMAPEQCLGSDDLGVETDLYAVAVIAFELLCGRPPFVGTPAEIEHAHVGQRPPEVSAFADVPSEVETVFRRALAKWRTERFPSARELYRALEAALASTDRRATATGPSSTDSTRSGELAVLAVQLEAPLTTLKVRVAETDGEMLHLVGSWYIIGFPHAVALEQGIRAAALLGGRLEPIAPRRVVHVLTVRVRKGRHGIVATGPGLERPETWLPGQPIGGVQLTRAAASAIPRSLTRPASDGTSVWAPGVVDVDADAIPLRGRDELLRTLCAELDSCLRERRAGIATIAGAVGSGKTRIVRELAAQAAARGVAVLTLTAQPLEAGQPGEPGIDRLIGLGFGVGRTSSRTDVAAAVTAVLGRDDAAVRDAITQALGGPSEGRRDPGVQRRLVASALGEALQRRCEHAPQAILVDNAHWADPVLLDALEAAAVSEAASPLWVAVTTQPRFSELRPTWGQRADAHAHELAPLDREATRAALVDLLHPADFVPAPILERIVEQSAGLPLHVVQLAQLMRRQGAIRRLHGTESYYVAGDDVLHASATPLAERLAARSLGMLPPALAELARIAAVIEYGIGARTVDAVISRVPHDLANLDPSRGLATLADHGLLRSDVDGYRFESPLLAEAIRGAIEPGHRRRLHAAVADHLGDASLSRPSDLARLASHGAASGQRELAAGMYLRLAELAARTYNSVDAERHATAALGQLEPDAPEREQALALRGQARMRMWQLAGAIEDLAAAATLADARGDRAAVTAYLLDEATVHDWMQGFTRAGEIVESVRPFIDTIATPLLRARWQFGVGRSRVRAERMEEGVIELARAAELAVAANDHETHATSLVLLAGALALIGRLEEAEARFEEVIDRCERVGDLVHLGVAHANRIVLWAARRDYVRAVADLERARRIARSVGFAMNERIAVHNLAELMLWLGRLDEALAAGLRSRDLEARFVTNRTPVDTLLVARIRCARGEVGEARALVEEIAAAFTPEEIDPTQKPLLDMVRLACDGGDGAAWLATLDASAGVSLLDERLEIVEAGARSALARGDREAARAILARAGEEVAEPWAERLARLAAA